MKKIALLGVLALLAMPILASAQVSPPVETTDARELSPHAAYTSIAHNALFVQPVQSAFQTPSLDEQRPLLQQAAWYYDYNGIAWSNICQTPYFWVSFGRRYYMVGSDCVATLNGATDYGVMVQR